VPRSPRIGRDNGLAKLEQVLNVKFKSPDLLRQATVHRSFLNESESFGLESYERLEYLGDAFLGWVVAEELFCRFPSFSEGDMTRARAQMVQGKTLAEIARGFDIGSFLHLGQGEDSAGGRERQSNLAGALEAIVGAVLIDRGPRVARQLVLGWLRSRIDVIETQGIVTDPKSKLQEIAQRRGFNLPEYRVVEESGPSHAPKYRVQVLVGGEILGIGGGARKIDAEQDAALTALPRMTKP
jgi:ribonuclease-3